VTQGVGPEFKPHYWKKKKEEEEVLIKKKKEFIQRKQWKWYYDIHY
jgi:hypothetical protein